MRRFACTLVAAVALCAAVTAPALALNEQGARTTESEVASPMVDILVYRPVGLIGLAVGAMMWLPAAGITMLVEPSSLGVPTEALINKPFRFVFTDPIGSH